VQRQDLCGASPCVKGVIFFNDVEKVGPLSRILPEGNWKCKGALIYLWLSQRQDLGSVSLEPKEVCSSVVFFGDIPLACLLRRQNADSNTDWRMQLYDETAILLWY